MSISALFLILAFLCFVYAAIRGRSVLAAGLACLALASILAAGVISIR